MKSRTLITCLAIAALVAVNSTSAATGSTAIENPESGPVEAAAVDARSPSLEAASRFTEGMHIPVDGSSLEAFEQSLEKIREQTTEAEYTTLTNAIDYLLVYDLSARRDREKLAANLDGLTGEEIVDKVQWSQNRKRRAR